MFLFTVSLSHRTVHFSKGSSFLQLRDFTNSHRHNYFNNIKTRSIHHSRQKCYLTFELVLTTFNVSVQLEKDRALVLLFTLGKCWESLNEGEWCVSSNAQGWMHTTMPHLHKQTLMVCSMVNGVCFPEKHYSKNPSHQQQQHTRPQTLPCWKDKTGAYGNTCFCESKSQFQALQVRYICHSWELAEAQPLPRKEMALSYPHGWKISYHSPKPLRKLCPPSLCS